MPVPPLPPLGLVSTPDSPESPQDDNTTVTASKTAVSAVLAAHDFAVAGCDEVQDGETGFKAVVPVLAC